VLKVSYFIFSAQEIELCALS